jgi:hypothetical protein
MVLISQPTVLAASLILGKLPYTVQSKLYKVIGLDFFFIFAKASAE